MAEDETMESFILQHKNDIIFILEASDTEELPFRSWKLDLNLLQLECPALYKKLLYNNNIWNEKPKWIEALNKVQETIKKADISMGPSMTVKKDFPVCFVNLPGSNLEMPSIMDMNKLIQVKGNVVKARDIGFRENTREYKCQKCKQTMLLHADRFQFRIPEKCVNTGCTGKMHNVEDPNKSQTNYKHFIDYQEISILVGNNAEQLTIELDQELSGSCNVGDRVTIVGTFEQRYKPDDMNNIKLAVRAASVCINENQQKLNIDPDELTLMVKMDWEQDLDRLDNNELSLRDEMVGSVAPELEGLSLAKLGLLLVLCSGGRLQTDALQRQSPQRDIAHLLLIGDPGLGKSQLLKAAAKISTNSVTAIGYSTTTAGLTARCYREDGDLHVEAGALVKANNGVCCIDEINCMTKEHRSAIHEMMESQKITISKAGVRTELPTKCSIIAGMNQRNSNLPTEAKNLGLEPSLLSRFDFVFELETPTDMDYYERIADHILRDEELMQPAWSNDRLQSHIFVVRDFIVTMSHEACEVLKRYYSFYRDRPDIHESRISIRLWCSLERLTKCHAKLMMRKRAEIIDAVTVVMLFESSWSFGCLMGRFDIMQAMDPIGPSNKYIAAVLEKLDLENLLDEVKPITQLKVENMQSSQDDDTDMDLNEIFGQAEKIQGLTSRNVDEIFSTQAINSFNQQKSSQFTQSSRIQYSSFQKPQPGISNPFDGLKMPTNVLREASQKATESNSDGFDDDNFDIFEDEVIKQHLSTSTQREKRKSIESIHGENKKLKSETSQTDPLDSNLKALAAFFAEGNSPRKSLPKTNLALNATKAQPSSSLNATNKLKKYQFSEKADTQKSNENDQLSKQPSQLTEAEQKFFDELDTFDVWN